MRVDLAHVVPRHVMPALPHDRGDDGWDWMAAAVAQGWYVLPSWGAHGWDMGAWPLVVVVFAKVRHEGRTVWGLATRVEGDVWSEAYPDRESFCAAADQIAHLYWRLGQADGPEPFHWTGPYPEAYYGPCRATVVEP